MPSNTTVTVENIRALLRSTYFRATFSLNLPAAHPSQQAHHNGPYGQLAITLGRPPTQYQTTTTIPIFGMASRPHPLPPPSTPLPRVGPVPLADMQEPLSPRILPRGGGIQPPASQTARNSPSFSRRTSAVRTPTATPAPPSTPSRLASPAPSPRLGEHDCRRPALVFFHGSAITLGYHHVNPPRHEPPLARSSPRLAPFQIQSPIPFFPGPPPLAFESDGPPGSCGTTTTSSCLSVTRTFARHDMT